MILRYGFAAIAAALLVSSNASALSCAQPNLERTMEKAKASDTVYYILVGKFTANTPKTERQRNRLNQFDKTPPTITKSYFDGYSLSPEARSDVPLSGFPITIETSCIGPWCSSVPSSNQTQIAFVEARPGQAPVLRISPCTDKVFPVRSEENPVKKLRSCFDRLCGVDEKEHRLVPPKPSRY